MQYVFLGAKIYFKKHLKILIHKSPYKKFTHPSNNEGDSCAISDE